MPNGYKTNKPPKAASSDSDYTIKLMSDFTILNNEEQKAMEEIMRLIKSRKKG